MQLSANMYEKKKDSGISKEKQDKKSNVRRNKKRKTPTKYSVFNNRLIAEIEIEVEIRRINLE